MSQKGGDKARTRGRPSAAGGAAMHAGEVTTAAPPAEASTVLVTTEATELDQGKIMSSVSSQTDTDSILESILKRLETIDEKVDADIEHRNAQTVHMDRFSCYMKESRETWGVYKRRLMISEHQLSVAKETNRRLEAQVNALDNQIRICNLRIDGKREIEDEDLTHFVMDLAKQVGANSLKPSDIITVERMGKKPTAQQQGQHNKTRPRTVMLTLVNKQIRNKIYFARSRLHNVDRFKGIYVNDDVAATTRRQREEYRSVAVIARSQGAEIRIHDDGLVIDGKKYMLGEAHTLPMQYSMEKARTVESGGELYFASHHSFLSNFAYSPIVKDEVLYPTAEHLYQAQKCEHAQDMARLDRVIKATTPLEAKRIADEIKETPEWRGYRDEIMSSVIKEKFSQNRELAVKLVDTGVMQLNEATHNDYYGIGVAINSKAIKDKSYRGTNRLGQILMARRDDINITMGNK